MIRNLRLSTLALVGGLVLPLTGCLVSSDESNERIVAQAIGYGDHDNDDDDINNDDNNDDDNNGWSSYADIQAGRRLFNHRQFGTNGRTCSTCHVASLSGSITPEFIEHRYQRMLRKQQRNPSYHDPLFDPLDADVPGGNTYNRLRQTATFLIPLTMHQNVTVDNCGSPAHNGLTKVEQDGRCTVFFPRTSLPIQNLAFETLLHAPADSPPLQPNPINRIMWDGREPTFESQALGAALTHFATNPLDPSQLPTETERHQLVAFQMTKFSTPDMRRYARELREGNVQHPPSLPGPQGLTASQLRGREFFLEREATLGRRGLCSSCHGGDEPGLLRTQSRFSPVPTTIPAPISVPPDPEQIAGLLTRFHNVDLVLSPQFNNMNGFPVYTFRVADPYQVLIDPPGSPPRTVPTADIGETATSGSLAAQGFLNLILNPGGGLPLFRIPSLVGIGQRMAQGIPMFHDGSMHNSRDIVVHYQAFFNEAEFLFEIATDPNFDPAHPENSHTGDFLHISNDDMDDIESFLQIM